jgi:hypothetical protein
MIRSVQEQQAVAMLEHMPAHAHVQIYQQRQKHNCDLLNIHNLKFTNMTHAEQRAYLRARAFPETTLVCRDERSRRQWRGCFSQETRYRRPLR